MAEDTENDLQELKVKSWRQIINTNGHMSQRRPRFLEGRRAEGKQVRFMITVFRNLVFTRTNTPVAPAAPFFRTEDGGNMFFRSTE
jgi:hypothetical protein